jgi:hypothetical protein
VDSGETERIYLPCLPLGSVGNGGVGQREGIYFEPKFFNKGKGGDGRATPQQKTDCVCGPLGGPFVLCTVHIVNGYFIFYTPFRYTVAIFTECFSQANFDSFST